MCVCVCCCAVRSVSTAGLPPHYLTAAGQRSATASLNLAALGSRPGATGVLS